MPAIVVETIGPDGIFPTLSDWAAALPADLTVSDEIRVAELGATTEDPGGAVISCICDATRYVVVRARAGSSVADLADPDVDPLRIEPGQGGMVHTVSGPAIALTGAMVVAEIHGLQIASDNGPALSDGGAGSAFTRITGCVLQGNSAVPVAEVRGAGSELCASAVIQRGSGDGVALTGGATVEGCTLFKPKQNLATGTGVSASAAPSPELISVAVSGFGESFDPAINGGSNLASDQVNLLTAPEDLNDPSWSRISASIVPGDTIVGPTGVPLQWVGNNLNAFSYFSAGVVHSLQPGERFAFSMIVSDVTAIISALLLDATPNKPEMRVDWQTIPPTVSVFGASASVQTIAGTVTDLGAGAYRMYLEAENPPATPVDIAPIFYVTRGVENVGLDVGMYAGSAMAGNGHLGNGFTQAGSVPGTNPVTGFDPGDVFEDETAALLDLRPVPGSALDTTAPVTSVRADLYGRLRATTETVGSVALGVTEPAIASDLAVATAVDAVHALDETEILSAYRNRTVLPDSPSRVISV